MPDLAAEFEAFRRLASDTRKLFDTHCKLFGDEETEALLRKNGGLFFWNLSNWLADYHALLACRLTDRADTKVGGRDRYNLTSKYIVLKLRESKLLTPEIEKAAQELQEYRRKIVVWRNKRIAHADHSTVMGFSNLVAHDFSDLERFYSALDTFCEQTAIQLGVKSYSTLRISEGFDGVGALLRRLKQKSAAT